MSNFWRYFVFLSWISYLLVCGVLLFTQGFFLRRQVQTETSRCDSNLYCSEPFSSKTFTSTSGDDVSENVSDSSPSCNALPHPLTHLLMSEDICSEGRTKVILIIIDALRYDFVAHTINTDPKPFENRLTVIHEALEKKPNNARLYKFIADPPTTTMQRLKALTTGSFPTFIDVSSNFASKEIDEDNIIDQLLSKKKTAVFMGDDTWTYLYPQRFKREYPYPSFNVWDLDTVDNGIRKHLMPEMKKKDWNLLVAHFLGVDHCGHRYGPFHPEMSRKLDEMNQVLREVISAAEDDSLVVVLGDHGMTSTGDHGGGTQAEVTAALFMYSPSGFLPQRFSGGNTLSQIDLVPTLAAVLGIPIPFSNVGTIIVDALPRLPASKPSLNTLPDWQYALLGLWSNARQAMTYIQTYAERNRAFSKQNLQTLNKMFLLFSNNVSRVTSESEFLSVMQEGKQFLSSLSQMCRKVWVQFDTFSLTWGLVFTIVVLMILFLIMETLPFDMPTFPVSGLYLSLVYISLLASAVCSYLLHIRGSISSFDFTYFMSTFGVSFIFLAVICADNAGAIYAKLSNLTDYKTWTDLFCRFVCTLTLWAATSNSYVVAEGSVLSFLLFSMCLALVYSYRPPEEVVPGSSKQKIDKSTFGWLKSQVHPMQAKVIALAITLGIAVRVTYNYWRCRDEQWGCSLSYRQQPPEVNSKGTVSADPHALAMLVCTALWVTVTRMWLRACGNLTGYSQTVLLSRYVPTVIAVCSSCFWVLQGLPGDTRNKLFKPWQLQILPWTVYSLSAFTIFNIILQPLCVFVVTRGQTKSFSIQLHKNPIPQLYNQMKKMISGSKRTFVENGSTFNNRPMVYGLATAYSATFTVLAVLLVLVLGLLLGPQMSQAIIILACAAVVLLLMFSILRFQNIIVSVQLLNTSWASVLCWSLLAQYAFYGTGHQATFASIQWDAAMVGTNGNIGGSKILPAALVIANTYCSHILMGLLLPLILIAPLTFYIMAPQWACVTVSDQELAQGELLLFHREELSYRSLATLTSRYIFLQASRSLACMLAATIHARHLMAWAVFAPKFIFEALALFVTLPCVLLSFLLVGRITSCIHTLLNSVDSKVSKGYGGDNNKR